MHSQRYTWCCGRTSAGPQSGRLLYILHLCIKGYPALCLVAGQGLGCATWLVTFAVRVQPGHETFWRGCATCVGSHARGATLYRYAYVCCRYTCRQHACRPPPLDSLAAARATHAPPPPMRTHGSPPLPTGTTVLRPYRQYLAALQMARDPYSGQWGMTPLSSDERQVACMACALWGALPLAIMAMKPDGGGEERLVCAYARTTPR